MQHSDRYCMETSKSPAAFARDFETIIQQKGFVIHNRDSMDMAAAFAHHDISTAADFDLHMIQICKPAKAALSLSVNPERAVLMPKFVMAFSQGGRTQIRFLRYSADDIRATVADDGFAESLADTYEAIMALIRVAA